MTKTDLAKAVVSNLTGYSVGVATTMFLAVNRKHSDNRVVETAIDISTIVTGFAVGGMIHEQVRDHTDQKIDDIVKWWNENVKNTSK